MSTQRTASTNNIFSSRVLIILLGFMSIPICEAENLVFDYLLRTPLTLMDAGVIRIKEKLVELNTRQKNKPNNLRGILGNVRIYEDYIYITANAYPVIDGAGNPTCRDVLIYTEETLGFCWRGENPRDDSKLNDCNNKLKHQFLTGSLDRYFSHFGYTADSRPEELGELLAPFVVVEAGIIPESGKKTFCHRISEGVIRDGQWPGNPLEKYLRKAK